MELGSGSSLGSGSGVGKARARLSDPGRGAPRGTKGLVSRSCVSLPPRESLCVSVLVLGLSPGQRVGSAGAMAGGRLAPLVLSDDERRTLENWVKRRSTAQGLAVRARIVLACAQGGSNLAVAARLGVNRNTVSRWRAGFLRERLDGLSDEPRPGGAAHHHRCPGGGGGGAHAGGAPRGRHALVEAGAGGAGGHLAVQCAADLAGVRAAALADRDVQALPGPAADRQDPRRGGPVPC